VPSGGELEIHDTSSHSLNNLIERNRRSFVNMVFLILFNAFSFAYS